MSTRNWAVLLMEDYVRRHYFPNGEPLADMDIIDPVWAEKHRQETHVPSFEEELQSIPLNPPPLGRPSLRDWDAYGFRYDRKREQLSQRFTHPSGEHIHQGVPCFCDERNPGRVGKSGNTGVKVVSLPVR